jgi:transcriptional regulator NrdR family protein
MKCPECGFKTIVKDTRLNERNEEQYRSRLCVSCGYRFYTVEVEVEPNENFLKSWKRNCRKSGGKVSD